MTESDYAKRTNKKSIIVKHKDERGERKKKVYKFCNFASPLIFTDILLEYHFLRFVVLYAVNIVAAGDVLGALKQNRSKRERKDCTDFPLLLLHSRLLVGSSAGFSILDLLHVSNFQWRGEAEEEEEREDENENGNKGCKAVDVVPEISVGVEELGELAIGT